VNDPVNQVRSVLPGIAWPAVPGQEAAQMLALQFQLERSQWLAPAQLRELQFRQLDVLLRHAHDTVPYYRERWRGRYDPGRPLTPDAFSGLPVLTRSELQSRFDALKSARIPADHGRVAESRTSGSTGAPVRVLKTGLVQLMWQAIVLREHQWFQRNLGGKLAAVRQGVADGEADGWGPATDGTYHTGRSATLSIRTDVDTQLRWLEAQQPDYLLTYPSNVTELARTSLARGVRIARLREVRTFGEILTPETRKLCRLAWGVPVVDAYSSDEAGYMALQCPEHEHYHVQSENALLEVVDDQGNPCGPGETGKVTVTALHNFAMPLVRYELADYAEVGEACPCGRGLPVLKRIVGRVRNMLVAADGKRYWPTFGSAGLAGLAPVLRQQLVQKTVGTIEVRLVTARPLVPEEEARLRGHILTKLPVPVEIRFSYHEALPRGAGGKFEDFVSEVPATA
jgi:phenylacetate-coenzyme A ligase PaaK-like adenylate-forming protein